MSLRFEHYPFDLSDLGGWLTETLPIVEQRALSGDALELVGPFPSYYVDPREFIKSGPKTASKTGWRALVLQKEKPTAVVDISLSTGGVSRYAARGEQPAIALARALEVVVAAEVDGTFEVRWLSLADIYVTAVWLSGAHDRFVPTRLGGTERAEAKEMTLDQLQAIVVALVRNSTSLRPDSFFESLSRFTKSPRSGLPEG